MPKTPPSSSQLCNKGRLVAFVCLGQDIIFPLQEIIARKVELKANGHWKICVAGVWLTSQIFKTDEVVGDDVFCSTHENGNKFCTGIWCLHIPLPVGIGNLW